MLTRSIKNGCMLCQVLVIAISLFAMQLNAQSSISGRVVEADGLPLEFATVALYSAADSALQGGTITNSEGQYAFEKLKQGKYMIVVSMIGYGSETLRIDISDSQNYALPDVTIRESAQQLSAVTVTATRQFVEQHADKMVINPEASITSASDDVLEVLRKSPGVIIDKDDNITLKNKSVRVMIDGRPTHISGEQLAAMLRTMQATSVDRIEIIENPSARFDAEGDGGIINIRTKRGLMRGYNGSITLGARTSNRFSNNYGIDLNYRNEKMNIYGNYYGGQNRSWNDVDLTRKFLLSDGSSSKQYSKGDNNSNYNNAKLGIDYNINHNQVVGFMVRGNFGTWKSNRTSNTRTSDISDNELQMMYTHLEDNNKYHNMLANLNYKWTIDSLGHELSIDADMAYYYSQNLSDMATSYIPPQAPQIFFKNQSAKSDFYSIKADYVLPLSNMAKLEMGMKSSFASIDSNLDYTQQDKNGAWSDPGGMSNHFVYSENINAAYISGNYKFNDKTSVQLGFRGEQTISKGNNITIEQSNERNYFNLFPSFFAQHKFNDRHQLVVSYSYRIGRPPYGLLNPFVWMLDPYTYNKGNPFLQPQFTHSSRLSYTLNNKYILALSYGYTNDVWVQIFDQEDDTRTTIIGWENLNIYYNTNATAVLPFEIAKWWKTNTSLTGFYGKYKSPYNDGKIDKSQFTFQGNTTFTFALPKDFAIELSGYYTSKVVYSVAIMQPRGWIDLGAQKMIFDKKATLRLSISDVFKLNVNSYVAQHENINLKGSERWDSRRINLTFTWRFGRSDIKAARQRSSGLEEELIRN